MGERERGKTRIVFDSLPSDLNHRIINFGNNNRLIMPYGGDNLTQLIKIEIKQQNYLFFQQTLDHYTANREFFDLVPD